MAKVIRIANLIIFFMLIIILIIIGGWVNKIGYANNQLQFRDDSAFLNCDFDIIGGLEYEQCFALFYFDTTINIDLNVNEYKIITDSEDDLYNVVYNYHFLENNDTISPSFEGYYLINWKFSAEGNVGAVFETHVNNSVLYDGAMPVTVPVVNNLIILQGTAVVYLDANEKFCIDVRNIANSTDITIKKGFVFIRKLPKR